MPKWLERIRGWLTPRRRFWIGAGLFAMTIVVPVMSPGTSVSFLLGPASVFLVGAFMPVANGKQ